MLSENPEKLKIVCIVIVKIRPKYEEPRTIEHIWHVENVQPM